MNNARPAGESGRLEVSITRKAYAAPSGERRDILRDITFSLERNEVGALVGPSGSGKTTMLRIIAGLETDYEGSIRRPPGRLGMVFQEPRLLPWRTVEENVRLVAPQMTEAALESLFEVLEIATHRAHYPGELSLGLARRTALARAYAVDPNLLLLDEPFVSLDEALAQRLRRRLAILVEERAATTLLVTHDLDEAVRLADRVFLLSGYPSRLAADIPLPAPRRSRSEQEIGTMTAEIAERIKASDGGRPAGW